MCCTQQLSDPCPKSKIKTNGQGDIHFKVRLGVYLFGVCLFVSCFLGKKVENAPKLCTQVMCQFG